MENILIASRKINVPFFLIWKHWASAFVHSWSQGLILLTYVDSPKLREDFPSVREMRFWKLFTAVVKHHYVTWNGKTNSTLFFKNIFRITENQSLNFSLSVSVSIWISFFQSLIISLFLICLSPSLTLSISLECKAPKWESSSKEELALWVHIFNLTKTFLELRFQRSF